jgi:hypothetical protein
VLTLVRETEVDPRLAHYQDEGYARLTRELIFDTVRECCEHRKFQKIACPIRREVFTTQQREKSRKYGGGYQSITEDDTREFINSVFFERAIQSIGCCPIQVRQFLDDVLNGNQDQKIHQIEEYFFNFRKSKMSEQDGRTLRHVKKKQSRKQA